MCNLIPLKWPVLSLAIVDVNILEHSKSVMSVFLKEWARSPSFASAFASASVMVGQGWGAHLPSFAKESAHSFSSIFTCAGIHCRMQDFPLHCKPWSRTFITEVTLVSPILIASKAFESEKTANPAVGAENTCLVIYSVSASLIVRSSLVKFEAIRPVLI